MNGYEPDFLGHGISIPIPWIDYETFADVLKRDELRNNYIADYVHYSVVMSKKNRQAYLSICNLDQNSYRSVTGRKWFLDHRIGAENQLDNRYYKGSLWDRGHLTRRTAVTWGASNYEARQASNQSCSYANACLQHKNFNEDEWRIPEKVARRFERDVDGKLCIMTGPIFDQNDRWLEPDDYDVSPGRIPSGFWKVMYYVDAKKTAELGHPSLGCEAYLVWQDGFSVRAHDQAASLDVETFQVTVSELQDLTGIEFPQELYDANPLWYHATEERGIMAPERYRIKSSLKSKGVRRGWEGHVIHDREDIEKHSFERASD